MSDWVRVTGDEPFRTSMLCVEADGRIAIASRYEDWDGWLDDISAARIRPTHAMLLPAPPTDTSPASPR